MAHFSYPLHRCLRSWEGDEDWVFEKVELGRPANAALKVLRVALLELRVRLQKRGAKPVWKEEGKRLRHAPRSRSSLVKAKDLFSQTRSVCKPFEVASKHQRQERELAPASSRRRRGSSRVHLN